MTLDQTALTRALNDILRVQRTGGRILLTAGVTQVGVRFMELVLAAIARQTEFEDGNDPYEEHDFGSVVVCGRTLFWKIDYYDAALAAGSDAPWDPKRCTRVMTVMLAEEY